MIIAAIAGFIVGFVVACAYCVHLARDERRHDDRSDWYDLQWTMERVGVSDAESHNVVHFLRNEGMTPLEGALAVIKHWKRDNDEQEVEEPGQLEQAEEESGRSEAKRESFCGGRTHERAA